MMDDDEEYAENRDELLNRFRNSLSLPLAERFFSEDDLIEIFDYAGDLNDDFLRVEVLLCGARFHPESEGLLVRRGIFFSQLSDEAREQFLSYTKDNGNPILDILKLRNSGPMDDDEAQDKLEKMIASFDKIEDEEIIQFVDLVSSLNQYQWLKENFDAIREKASFVNVLLYETAIVAENNHDYEFGAKLLEELTENEPFNSYYWLLLSRQYAQMEEFEKGLSAIDYSLAINPEAYNSMLVKAKLLYTLEHPLEEVLSLARQAVAISHYDVDCVRFLAHIYHSENQDEMACQVFIDALTEIERKAETDEEEAASVGKLLFEFIPDLIMYRPDNLPQLLDQFYAASEDNSQLIWMSWAHQLSMQGHADLAKEVLECFERNSGINVPSLFAIEDAFTSQNFLEALKEINDYLSTNDVVESSFPSILTMHIISMVKAGEVDRAYSLCEFITGNIFLKAYSTVGNRLEYLGMLQIVKEIKRHIKKDEDDEFWQTYDPLKFWEDDDSSNP